MRTILKAAHRYVAYTSDIGESFRPVAHPWLVRGAYGISWLYLTGDVANEGNKAYQRQYPSREDGTRAVVPVNPLHDYRTVMVQRALFQSVASMGLPAFTIHSVVKYSGRQFRKAKNRTLRTWGPIGLGLAVVPALPYMFDEPVEHAVEWLFHKTFEMYGAKKGKVSDKEL